MIKKIEKKITVLTSGLALGHPAFGKEDTIYDEGKKELTINQKVITGKNWRLVHDGEKVISLQIGQGITYTLEKCVEFKTEKEALAGIEQLKLKHESQVGRKPDGEIIKNKKTV